MFVSGDNAPIHDVRCTGYSSGNDSIASWTSDKNGIIDFQQKGVTGIVATHPDFSDKYIKTTDLKSERDVVVMTPAVALNEVVVTPQDVQEFTTHTSYRLSEKEMERYTNVERGNLREIGSAAKHIVNRVNRAAGGRRVIFV